MDTLRSVYYMNTNELLVLVHFGPILNSQTGRHRRPPLTDTGIAANTKLHVKQAEANQTHATQVHNQSDEQNFSLSSSSVVHRRLWESAQAANEQQIQQSSSAQHN